VNIGSNYYVQTVVPDPTKIFVNIGLGFCVEFLLDEVAPFCLEKEKVLRSQVTKLNAKAQQINRHLQMVSKTIEQLLSIGGGGPNDTEGV